MRVVSNTGPLDAAAKIGRLDLLLKLYERLMIPPEVLREIQTGVELGYEHSRTIAGLIESRQVIVIQPEPTELIFERKINLGEIGAIRLALQETADLILIDDWDARLEAERLGLEVKGTVGIILAALKQNLISKSEATRIMEVIAQRPDIWVSKQMIRAVLETIGG